jgi:hypothetical protein
LNFAGFKQKGKLFSQKNWADRNLAGLSGTARAGPAAHPGTGREKKREPAGARLSASVKLEEVSRLIGRPIKGDPMARAHLPRLTHTRATGNPSYYVVTWRLTCNIPDFHY